MEPHSPPWYAVANVAEVASPALLIYAERVEDNLRRMIAMAGGTERLRPHIKTHKMAELVRWQVDLGIRRFKCATMAEAELAAGAGAPDVLLAYPPVGPNIERLHTLVARFPGTAFSTVADDAEAVRALARTFADASRPLDVLVDVDCGMHRTGIEPGPAALELYRQICALKGLRAGGLHAYDGHIHATDVTLRQQQCDEAFARVDAFRRSLEAAGLPVPRVVAGGTPTFPIHARRPGVECSPGTCVFWDAGYSSKLPDLAFLPAALVLTRVVSKPAAGRLCLDLGHKAIAAENPAPRVLFPELPDAKSVNHSEEHLVVESTDASRYAVGDCLYGIPWHICPTVALHGEAVIIRNGRAIERWPIPARNRRITI